MVNNRLYSTRNAPHVALMRQSDIMQAAAGVFDSPRYAKNSIYLSMKLIVRAPILMPHRVHLLRFAIKRL
jgi:hypothetical protein